MAEPGKKPFDYERAKQLMATEGKSPGFYNALEERILEHERANGIASEGMADPDDTPAVPAPPVAAPQPAPLAQPQAPVDDEVSLWERFLGGANELAQHGADAEQAFMRTDYTDKLGSALAASLPVYGDPEGTERVYREGGAYPDVARNVQQEMRMREERSPTATRFGDAGQALAPAVAAPLLAPFAAGAGATATTLAPAAAALPGRMAAGAAEGASIGGTQRMGSAPVDASEEQLWSEFLEGAKVGGAFGAAAPVVGNAIGAGVQKVDQLRNAVAEDLSRSGLRNRTAAAGYYGGDLSRAVREQGRELPERIGQAIEDSGADQRVGGWLPKSFPMGSSAYADSLPVAKARVGQQLGGAVDDATARGAAVPQREVVAAMRGAQANSLAQNVDSGDAMAKNIDSIAERLTAERAGRGMVEGPGIAPQDRPLPYSPRELWDKRHSWKGEADLDPQAIVTPEATGKAAAYREGRNVLGEKIRGAMNEGEQAAFDTGNEQYGLLAQANNAALNREAKELGNAPLGINSPGAATAGALMMGGPGAALGVAGAESMRRGLGRDLYADVARAGSKALRVPEAAAATAPQRYTSAAQDAARSGVAAGAADDFSFGSPAMAQPEQPQTQAALGKHPLEYAVDIALRANRGAALGQWAPELEKAFGTPDFGATMLRLQRDPAFMREVMPGLDDFSKRHPAPPTGAR